jgi:hypothetical protein
VISLLIAYGKRIEIAHSGDVPGATKALAGADAISLLVAYGKRVES